MQKRMMDTTQFSGPDAELDATGATDLLIGEEAADISSLPPWLDPEDEMPPVALQAIYGRLEPAVTKVCERARRAMRDPYVAELRIVRDALAPSGLFKAWCEAAGIKYQTAKNIVARAEQAEIGRKKQGTEYSTGTRSAARKRDQATPKPEPKLADETAVERNYGDEGDEGNFPPPDPDKPSSSRIFLTYAVQEYETVLAQFQALGKAWGVEDYGAIVALALRECISLLPSAKREGTGVPV